MIYKIAGANAYSMQRSIDRPDNFQIAVGSLEHGLHEPTSMDWIDLVQWPAVVFTVAGAWLVASQRKFKRNWAFWLFLVGNALWVIWGVHDRAHGLIFLQMCLAAVNIRGVFKNRF